MTRTQALIEANGDRPGVLNVCVLLTRGNLRGRGEFAKLEEQCRVIHLPNGNDDDYHTFRNEFCPATLTSEGNYNS